MSGFNRDELGQELRLVDVKTAAFGIGKAPGSDFSCAAVVEDAGVPSRLDPAPRGTDAAAGLAGNDDFLDATLRKIDFVFGRNLGQVQGIGRRTANRRHFRVMNKLNARKAAEATAGNYQGAARDER